MTGGPLGQDIPSEQLPRLVKTKLISFPIGSNPQIYLIFFMSLLAIISKLFSTLSQSLYQTVPNGGIGLILYIGYSTEKQLQVKGKSGVLVIVGVLVGVGVWVLLLPGVLVGVGVLFCVLVTLGVG